jgi:F0F1-type ATP synthase assembly protein I
MWRAYLIIALVIGFLVGGLLLLRSSANTRLPPDILEKARKRNAELKDDDDTV